MKNKENKLGIFEKILGVFGLGSTSTVFDFSDAPGGDLSLDDIFGDNPTQTTTTVPSSETPSVPAAETTPQTEPVIKTKTGTVYNKLEDAVSGIEHKDTLIAQLRERVKQLSGDDPLTVKKPVQAQPQAGPKSYLEDQEAYFADIAKAVEHKDTAAYMNAQQKLIWDTMGPLAPTISALSKANAERVVSSEIPDFKGFLNSEQYKRVQETSPLLADAIRSAEMNPQAASQLPELYKVAYLSVQGSRIPELVEAARREQTPVAQPRPTVHSSPVPPPATMGVPVTQPSLDTREGRKALIAKMEADGVTDRRW